MATPKCGRFWLRFFKCLFAFLYIHIYHFLQKTKFFQQKLTALYRAEAIKFILTMVFIIIAIKWLLVINFIAFFVGFLLAFSAE